MSDPVEPQKSTLPPSLLKNVMTSIKSKASAKILFQRVFFFFSSSSSSFGGRHIRLKEHVAAKDVQTTPFQRIFVGVNKLDNL
jgi:hypothetical protein